VCNLGSSNEMKGCKNKWITPPSVMPRTPTYSHVRVYSGIEAHRRISPTYTSDKNKRTHMSNSFSTSSGVTSLCTKMSGGLVLSINDSRKLRFGAGPGMKYSLAATPCGKTKSPVSPFSLLRENAGKSVTAPLRRPPHSLYESCPWPRCWHLSMSRSQGS
jgi:hypothetical protein